MFPTTQQIWRAIRTFGATQRLKWKQCPANAWLSFQGLNPPCLITGGPIQLQVFLREDAVMNDKETFEQASLLRLLQKCHAKTGWLNAQVLRRMEDLFQVQADIQLNLSYVTWEGYVWAGCEVGWVTQARFLSEFQTFFPSLRIAAWQEGEECDDMVANLLYHHSFNEAWVERLYGRVLIENERQRFQEMMPQAESSSLVETPKLSKRRL